MLYIRLLDFNAGASDDLRTALDSLLEDSQPNAGGIILDLRNNPGGLFIEAQKTVELFTAPGRFIVGTKSRSQWRNQEFYASSKRSPLHLPVVVLVNKNSASAAEIVAGALRYSAGAKLIGDTTYGKGQVQGFIRLPEGDALRLTVSRYYFEGERFVDTVDNLGHAIGQGLIPDRHYGFIEEDEFYQSLERSLLLYSFAHRYQEQIVSSESDSSVRQEWIDRLRKYAFANEFEYTSPTTQAASALARLADTKPLKDISARITELAKKHDTALFDKHGSYIWMRLRQIAFERKYGTYRAYRDVVLPTYELIKIASLQLKETD